MSRVQKEKLGGHRSFENSDKEMHPEWGGWDAPRRPEACKFTDKKKPHGADRGCCPFRNGDRQTDRHICRRRGRAWTRQRWTLSPKWVETALNRPTQRSRDLRLLPRLRVRVGWTPQLRNPATAVAAPASLAGPVTSGTLPAPPTRAGATPFADPGAPAGRRLPGPRVRAGDLRGTLREPEARAARLRVGGRPPSLSGRRAASLGGGEEGAVALASTSRSSPAHVPALCARARATPSHPPPFPRLWLSRWRARRRHLSPEPPATSPKQPAASAKSSKYGSNSAADPEALSPPTARLPGVWTRKWFPRPGSGGMES